jgi:uncharacterized protein (TIGR02270 family)
VLTDALKEGLSTITGLDIAAGLESDAPEGFESGPTEDPADENVRRDPDENVSWPNLDRVRNWWDVNQSRFTPGTRYYLGNPLSEKAFLAGLVMGKQRQRAAAALELCLLRPERGLFEIRARGVRQRLELQRLVENGPRGIEQPA